MLCFSSGLLLSWEIFFVRRSCGESISLPRQRRAAYYYCPCTSRESPDRFFFFFFLHILFRPWGGLKPQFIRAYGGRALAWIALVFVNREKRRDSDAVFVVFVTFCNFFSSVFPTYRLIFALVLLEVLAESKIRSTIISFSPPSFLFVCLLFGRFFCGSLCVVHLTLSPLSSLFLHPPHFVHLFRVAKPHPRRPLVFLFFFKAKFFFFPSFPSFLSHLHARFYRRAGKIGGDF